LVAVNRHLGTYSGYGNLLSSQFVQFWEYWCILEYSICQPSTSSHPWVQSRFMSNMFFGPCCDFNHDETPTRLPWRVSILTVRAIRSSSLSLVFFHQHPCWQKIASLGLDYSIHSSLSRFSPSFLPVSLRSTHLVSLPLIPSETHVHFGLHWHSRPAILHRTAVWTLLLLWSEETVRSVEASKLLESSSAFTIQTS
jgi:hypothetical protein